MPFRDDVPKLPLPWGKLADGSPGYRKAEVEHHEKQLLSFANRVWYQTALAAISEMKTTKKKRERAEQMVRDTYESLEPERPFSLDLHLGPWW